jgi:hypothetical protein
MNLEQTFTSGKDLDLISLYETLTEGLNGDDDVNSFYLLMGFALTQSESYVYKKNKLRIEFCEI